MKGLFNVRLDAATLCALLLCGLFAGCGGPPATQDAPSPPLPSAVSPASSVVEPPTAQTLLVVPVMASVTATAPNPSEEKPQPPIASPSEPQSVSATPNASASAPEPVKPPVTGAAVEAPPAASTPPPAATTRPTALTIRTPAASGKDTNEGGSAVIDYSNCNEGYVMVKYSGGASKVKIQIIGPDKITYTYDSSRKGFEVFPLTAGNGSYTVNVYTEVQSSQYALALGASFQANLSSSLSPYLYPSQYVNYNAESKAVAKGEELASSATTVLEVVSNVYNYVITNVTYDDVKANSVKSGYLPVPDSTLATGKGICFDYAALMATMLRSQNIPTRLEVGYVSGGIYHAWISIYTAETGWINGMIQFDGKSWKLLDPTFASNGNQSSSIMQFIGNGSNYQIKYVY